MGSYLLKSSFKFNLQKHHFVCLWINNQVLSKFYYLLIFSPCFNQMKIVPTVSCKEKFDSNNWKTAWPRMVLEWHLFLRLSLGYVWKMLSFVGKHLKLLPKRCLFIFCIFYWNEKELNQQVCLIKYVENEICNSTSHKKERKEQKHNPTSKTFLKLLKNFH